MTAPATNTAPSTATPTPFTFDVNAPRPHISNQQMIDSLKAFAAHRRIRTFTQSQYNAWPRRIAIGTTIANRFGGWWNALNSAGLRAVRRGKWSPENLMTTLEGAWRHLGHRPSPFQLKDFSHVTQGPYVRRWGSLKKACERLAQFHKGELTREQLLAPAPSKKRRSVPASLRYEILKRDHHLCTLCGRAAGGQAQVTLEIDHITPASRGGTNDPTNLRTLCMDCNRGKRDKD